MRLDKFLCEMGKGTRSQVKEQIRKGLVTVNGREIKSADTRIDEGTDTVCFCGEELSFRKFVYFMLNKPAGVVSATEDRISATVLGLLREEDRRPGLFPVGRLDKDTEGLLLLTNDGALAHRLLSPKKHVDKTYRVEIGKALGREEIEALEQGVEIGEGCVTLPASVAVLEERVILLTVHEGKFHQVKRMLQAVGNQVTGLKRLAFGGLSLDEGLLPGEYRELTDEELRVLRGGFLSQ